MYLTSSNLNEFCNTHCNCHRSNHWKLNDQRIDAFIRNQQPIYQLSVSVCLTSTVQVTPAKISEPSCNGESGWWPCGKHLSAESITKPNSWIHLKLDGSRKNRLATWNRNQFFEHQEKQRLDGVSLELSDQVWHLQIIFQGTKHHLWACASA